MFVFIPLIKSVRRASSRSNRRSVTDLVSLHSATVRSAKTADDKTKPISAL